MSTTTGLLEYRSTVPEKAEKHLPEPHHLNWTKLSKMSILEARFSYRVYNPKTNYRPCSTIKNRSLFLFRWEDSFKIGRLLGYNLLFLLVINKGGNVLRGFFYVNFKVFFLIVSL